MRGVAWIGRHILAALDWAFDTYVDPRLCEWANATDEEETA